jgi:hypothetical protein
MIYLRRDGTWRPLRNSKASPMHGRIRRRRTASREPIKRKAAGEN